MCLHYDGISTENFWKSRHRKNKSWCWCWKNVMIDEGKIYSPAKNTKIKPGWFISNRKNQLPFEDVKDRSTWGYEINRGIHVYSDTAVFGQLEIDPDWYMVRVKCFKKDFVAASVSSKINFRWKHYGGEAVFMKIFIPKSEIDRVLKKAEVK